jgi:2-succinyl-5-enolpyruvyl-6-hydroxy-3-cyclohexene-1-carboxylate synthase
VVCPGSRSAPLASAVGLLVQRGWGRLHTAIDERSAAFLGLGLGRASGQPAAVITTSGSAVANLLPAVVEADYGCIPLLLLTADRPLRLKGCGANQTVNQDVFLAANVRWFDQGDPGGLAALHPDSLDDLAGRALAHCRGGGGSQRGRCISTWPSMSPCMLLPPC